MRSFSLTLILVFVLAGCASGSNRALTADEAVDSDRGVREMLDGISDDLAREGPEAWMRYFVESPDFYMASDGKLVFPTVEDARRFVDGFDREVSSMSLTWSDVRIDPAAKGFALVAASYQEVIVKTSGTRMEFGGFFTGVAIETSTGWRLRTLHWSTPRESP